MLAAPSSLSWRSSANKGDFFGFVRRLVDANRVDRKLTSAEWLAAFDRSGGFARAQSAAIRELVDRGSREPEGRARHACCATPASRYTLDAKGVPQLQ